MHFRANGFILYGYQRISSLIAYSSADSSYKGISGHILYGYYWIHLQSIYLIIGFILSGFILLLDSSSLDLSYYWIHLQSIYLTIGFILYNTDPMHFRVSGFISHDYHWIYAIWISLDASLTVSSTMSSSSMVSPYMVIDRHIDCARRTTSFRVE